MSKTDSVYIDDIFEAISTIEGYINGINYSQFIGEEMRFDTVVSQLEIIGEAANKLSKEFSQANPDFPIKQAVEMRNFLIHGYYRIEPEVVWKTIEEDLPQLKSAINKIITTYN